MARTHARNLVSRASDSDWRALSRDAQWLYDVILRSPDLNVLGVCAIRERLWVKAAAGTTVNDVSDALAELEKHRFVVVDDETGEVLVRSYLRHDDAYRMPYMMTAVPDIAKSIGSPVIAGALVTEIPRVDLGELGTDPSKRCPEGAQQYVRNRLDEASRTLSATAAKGFPNRDGKGSPAPARTTEPEPEPEPEPNHTEPPPADDAPPPSTPGTTQQLIATWIDRQRRRPPKAVIGHAAQQVAALLAEGFDPDVVLDALRTMTAKELSPSTLPSLVNGAANRTTTTASVNGQRRKAGRPEPAAWQPEDGISTDVMTANDWIEGR